MKLFVGVHLACFGTPDAAAEHRRLTDHGFEPDPLVNLERSVEGGARARFNVVYVPLGKMREGRIQYVEQLTPEHVWQERYVNAGVRLSAVYVVAEDPVPTAARWARFAGLLPRPEGELVCLHTARGQVRIGRRETIARLLGSAPPPPALAGYALASSHPDRLAARCSATGLAVKQLGTRYAIALPAALGGAWLLESAGKEEDPS